MRKSASRFPGPTMFNFMGVSAGADIVSPTRARTARSRVLLPVPRREGQPGISGWLANHN